MKNLFVLLTFLFVSIVTALSQKRSTVTFGTGLFFRESFTGEIGNSSFSYRYDFTRRFSVFIQHDINTFSNMPADATGDFYTDEERRRGAIDRLDQYIRTLDPIFAATTEFGDGQYFVTSLGIGIKAVSTKKYSIGINVAGA